MRGDMRVITAELFDQSDSLFVVTTNGNLRRNNTLVMGAGAAAEAKRAFRDIERLAGTAILAKSVKRDYYLYGFLQISPLLGIFQTKDHWRNKADLNIIRMSTVLLTEWCYENPTTQVRMNFPGIGLGGLSESEVLKIIADLPETVTVCKR